jgi:hypothetical protein
MVGHVELDIEPFDAGDRCNLLKRGTCLAEPGPGLDAHDRRRWCALGRGRPPRHGSAHGGRHLGLEPGGGLIGW